MEWTNLRPRREALLLLLLWLLTGVGIGSAAGQQRPASAESRTVPVLVELFTSEGCSDCPPADALLTKLDAMQPVPGVQAIVLSEHVTYWDHQGWRDPYSLNAMTERQEEYVHRFGLDSSYTPQMVVDGTTQFVGGNGKALLAALNGAVGKPKHDLSITAANWSSGSVQFSVHASAGPEDRLFAVLAADATRSEVAAGENAGRTLHHTAVVRVFKQFGGDAADGRTLKLAGGPLTGKNEQTGPVRLVVFLVDRKTGHVTGAAMQKLNR